MIDRRRLMLSSAGLGLMAALPAAAQAPAVSGPDARLDAMLTRWFEETVDLSPEYATNLGLDRDARASLTGKLRQVGLADAEADRARARARWAEIQTVSGEGLSDQARVSLAVYRFTAEGAARAAEIPYGGGIGPYTVTQRSGAYFSVPDFMANQHRVETEADAAAFISRLEAFAVVLDQESERIVADGALGVVLPSFLMDKTLTQLRTRVKALLSPALPTPTPATLEGRLQKMRVASRAKRALSAPQEKRLERLMSELEMLLGVVQP